jgi:hypothetical protein
MPTAWGCGVVIAAWKGGSARLHAPDCSSWSALGAHSAGQTRAASLHVALTLLGWVVHRACRWKGMLAGSSSSGGGGVLVG